MEASKEILVTVRGGMMMAQTLGVSGMEGQERSRLPSDMRDKRLIALTTELGQSVQFG